MLFWKEWKRGESRIKEIMTERRELGEGWGRNKRRKGRKKKKKKREGETLFQAVKMNLHISFFFWRTFTQKFEGLKGEKLITKEKFLKFV